MCPTETCFQVAGSSFLNGVYFWNANVGVAYGDPEGTEYEIWRTTDGGVTFPTLLTPSGVPNSGSATITVPNVVTQTARIMVRAKENIYYAVNSRNILIWSVGCVHRSSAHRG